MITGSVVRTEADELRAKLAQAKADLKHAQKMNKELRQRASAEQQEKRYAGLVAQAQYWGQEAEDARAEADELRTDAERYRKLKAYLEELRSRGIGVLNLQKHAWNYDTAVDALPDVTA